MDDFFFFVCDCLQKVLVLFIVRVDTLPIRWLDHSLNFHIIFLGEAILPCFELFALNFLRSRPEIAKFAQFLSFNHLFASFALFDGQFNTCRLTVLLFL